MTTRRQEWANRTIPMVLILFVLAWGVRLVGVDVGYFFGDERINDAARAMTGQLIPGQHFYPPFLNYINAAAFAVLYAGGRVLDVWPDTAAFRAQYFSDPLPFYVTARVVVAGLAALTAPAFYLVARALRIDGWYAVGAGLLGLMYPLGVYQSHIAKSDVALASFAVLTLLALIRRHQPQAGGREDVVLAVAATIAISFKHSFVFLLLPLVIVHIIALWRSRSGAEAGKSFLRAMLTVGLLWPILNIGTVLDFQEFLAYQRIQSLMSHSDGSFLEAVRLFGTLAAGQVSGITITGAPSCPDLSDLPSKRALQVASTRVACRHLGGDCPVNLDRVDDCRNPPTGSPVVAATCLPAIAGDCYDHGSDARAPCVDRVSRLWCNRCPVRVGRRIRRHPGHSGSDRDRGRGDFDEVLPGPPHHLV